MSTPAPGLHVKSAARKLPIKRNSPLQNPDPNPNPNPNADPVDASAVDNGFYDGEEFDDDESDFGGGSAGGDGNISGGGGGLKPPPPFKFHRIWSESDEIRFLQGLLGCFSQGMVFPRDLNLFYDRFIESMPQPYTRSQLCEKLRRLRKKYRVMSARIGRGQDPSRLAPHDRDLLHLCTRLWHPSYAATSPFVSAPDGASPTGNKRRRTNPRCPSGLAPNPDAVAIVPSSTPSSQAYLTPPGTLALPSPVPAPVFPDAPIPVTGAVSLLDEENPAVGSHVNGVDEDRKPVLLPSPLPTPASSVAAGKVDTEQLLAKTVLDVFDGSLNELRMCVGSDGMCQSEEQSGNLSTFAADFTKRWREQRLLELEALAHRLRLVLEDSLQG